MSSENSRPVHFRCFAQRKENLNAVNLNQIHNPEADVWFAGTAMPTTRFALGVAAVNGSLYAIGGHEGWFGTPISVANERYTPTDFIPDFPDEEPCQYHYLVL